MHKAYALVNNRRTLFLGLTRKNTERLHEDKPIHIDLQAMLATSTLDGPVQDLVITAGETERDTYEMWSQFLPLPPYVEVGPDDAPSVFRREES